MPLNQRFPSVTHPFSRPDPPLPLPLAAKLTGFRQNRVYHPTLHGLEFFPSVPATGQVLLVSTSRPERDEPELWPLTAVLDRDAEATDPPVVPALVFRRLTGLRCNFRNPGFRSTDRHDATRENPDTWFGVTWHDLAFRWELPEKLNQSERSLRYKAGVYRLPLLPRAAEQLIAACRQREINLQALTLAELGTFPNLRAPIGLRCRAIVTSYDRRLQPLASSASRQHRRSMPTDLPVAAE